ncbi:hypothetical protein ACKF11_12880 [Methylobacillus sp. Pita2]|uniref:hypothetical protein n=1 Tax=Methylobacillus sp. Pita2 TaxID=3383245 RepID=UPI0038B64C1E
MSSQQENPAPPKRFTIISRENGADVKASLFLLGAALGISMSSSDSAAALFMWTAAKFALIDTIAHKALSAIFGTR